MAEKEDTKTADADIGTKLDNILSHVGDAMKRMDAMDNDRKADRARMDALFAKKDSEDEEEAKKKADAEKEEEEKKAADAKRKDEDESIADKKRKDAAEEEEKKCAADKAKKDAEEEDEKKKADSDDLKKRIADVEKVMARMSDADREELTEIQAKADSVYQAFGDRAPQPQAGEDKLAYRRRLAGDLKKHTTRFKDVNLHAIHDEQALNVIEQGIYADAEAAASEPANLPAGELRARKRVGDSGHTIIQYDGQPSTWMNAFAGPQRQAVTTFIGA